MRSQTRTNQEWLDSLVGRLDSIEQDRAFDDLVNYLFIVTCNHLEKKRGSVSGIQNLSDDDLAALAQEFVQEYMERMIKDDFALLAKFGGYGRFLSWSAQVTINLCNSELRRISWRRSSRLESKDELLVEAHYRQPDVLAYRQQVQLTIVDCLNSLPERHRFALLQCIVEGKSAADVGRALETSANAVHLLVYRAKKKMQKYLEKEGINSDVLSLLPS